MSGVTGRPCNLMIIDDPIKNMQEADSPTYRERIKAEWNASFKTRFASGAKVILIQTRWHEDDLAGYIIKNEKNVRVVNLPCEAEDNDPLGRNKGDALAPEIGKGNKWLQSFKEGFITTEGQRTWLALFQGKPTAQEGNLVKRTWWQYYKKEELPQMPVIALSIDATFKDKDTNDYVAIQVWGKRNNNYYLIDRLKERLDFIGTITAIKRMLSKHPKVTYKYIEDKANGSAIISVLRNQIDGIIAVEPEGGKVARANAVSYLIEGGNVFLPKDEAWVEEFVDEWSKFPNAEHDDEVDCSTQALNKLRRVNADAPNDLNKVFNFSFEKPQPNPIGRGDRQSVI
jgi:predicted phage terminase large subunit-like protein